MPGGVGGARLGILAAPIPIVYPENRLTQGFADCYKSPHRVFLYHLSEGDNT
jgi:hypothetical protein